MSGWTPGSAVIERLIQERRLESVKGAQADGSPWLERARQTLAAARAIEQANPDSAFVLAYDAARQACTALLAQQGLRPTTSGGHYSVEESVRPSSEPSCARSAPSGGAVTSWSTHWTREIGPAPRKRPTESGPLPN